MHGTYQEANEWILQEHTQEECRPLSGLN